MRLRKKCCYHCIISTIEKKSPPKVFCCRISDFVKANNICKFFKKKNNYERTINRRKSQTL